MKRRDAIVALASIFAAAAGRRMSAQQASAWIGPAVPLNPPSWFVFAIEEGGGLKFAYKGETVSVTADELWKALKEEKP